MKATLPTTLAKCSKSLARKESLQASQPIQTPLMAAISKMRRRENTSVKTVSLVELPLISERMVLYFPMPRAMS